MRFVKMHGLGNDYVYVDAFTNRSIERMRDLPNLARAISDRHRGVGSDGLILVCHPKSPAKADARMRMFNADGSESEMCGNGIRCVAKFAHDRLALRGKPLRIETGRGILSIRYSTQHDRLTHATVDMGSPILSVARIPASRGDLAKGPQAHEWTLESSAGMFTGVLVSMGNPHLVIFHDPKDAKKELTTSKLARLPLREWGPVLEHHRAFPQRINIHWVACRAKAQATMRTWERGAGTTQACGTGACAVHVAGVLTGRLKRETRLRLPGGELDIRWDAKSNHVFMTGPATDVFEGDWPVA